MKNIQIDYELFVDIYAHFIGGSTDRDNIIKQKLIEKADKIVAREKYTKYKTAEKGSQERENARQEYLNHKGISSDYISKSEVPYYKM